MVSRSLDAVPWGQHESATLVKSDLADAATHLKRQPGKNIGVHGSPTLVESLLQADLLDEMRLEIHPVLAGKGARVVRHSRTPQRLRPPIRSSPVAVSRS